MHFYSLEFSGLHCCLFVKVQARQFFVRNDFESLLSYNHFHAKDYCATALNEQALLVSWPCVLLVFSFRRNSVILACRLYTVKTFFRKFLKLFYRPFKAVFTAFSRLPPFSAVDFYYSTKINLLSMHILHFLEQFFTTDRTNLENG